MYIAISCKTSVVEYLSYYTQESDVLVGQNRK